MMMNMKSAQVLTVLLLALLNVYRSKGGEYRLCFKDVAENKTCKYASYVAEWDRKRSDVDCCNSDKAAYYVDTVNEHSRIVFHIVKSRMRNCLPCKKNAQTVNSTFIPPPSCVNKKCPGEKICKIRHGKVKCVCQSCSTPELRRHQPVCGTDGKTYKNECEFKRLTCKQGRSYSVEIAYDASCQTGCDNVVCRKNRTCVVDLYNVASCVACEMFHCSKAGSGRGGPICGADGVQYQSKCHLRLASCRQGKTIGVAYKGNCIANATCRNINCTKQHCAPDNFGMTRCVTRHCVYDNNNSPRCVTCTCDKSFPGPVKSSELCGTDNKTYQDYCSLKKEMCLGNTFIDVQHRGRCKVPGRISDDPAKPSHPTAAKSCKYEDLDMYFVTLKQFASILKKDFGLEVKKKPVSERFILMQKLIPLLQKKWLKITSKEEL